MAVRRANHYTKAAVTLQCIVAKFIHYYIGSWNFLFFEIKYGMEHKFINLKQDGIMRDI